MEIKPLLEWIKAKGGTVAVRDVKRGPRKYRDSPEEALETLVGWGLGTWQEKPPTKQGGRPSRVFVLADFFERPDTPAPAVLSPDGDLDEGSVPDLGDGELDFGPIPDRKTNFAAWYAQQVGYCRATARDIERRFRPKGTQRRPSPEEEPQA